MRILKENSLCMVIDIQERLLPYIYENEQVITNVKKLIEGLKIFNIPVILTEQYKKGLGNTVPSVAESLAQNVPSFEKISFSCCDDQPILSELKARGKKFIILCGIESHICVLQTTIDLIEQGFVPVVVADCVSSRKPEDKAVAIVRVRQEGAIVTTSESLLFELCRFAGSDSFKAISKLVK